MRKLLLPVVFILSIIKCYSQNTPTTPVDTSWKNGGFVNVNLTQVSLNQWAQGGENSFAVAGVLNLFANYEKDKVAWSNSMDLAYAVLKSGSIPLRKSDDKIDLTSKYGRAMSKHWSYSVLLNFKSQFSEGFNYPNDSVVISNFMAPGYVTLALGFNYKPVDYFEVFISPATGKLTVVNLKTLADAGAYGVEAGENTKKEFGAYLNMKFKKDIMENVTLTTKLELFDNYTDPDDNNKTNIDVNWETGLSLKVNKLITATVSTQLVYDDDVVKRTQFKEVLGVGLGYKF